MLHFAKKHDFHVRNASGHGKVTLCTKRRSHRGQIFVEAPQNNAQQKWAAIGDAVGRWQVVGELLDFSALVGSLSAFSFAYGTFLLNRVGSSRLAVLESPAFPLPALGLDRTQQKTI